MPAEIKRDWIDFIQHVYASAAKPGASSVIPIFGPPTSQQMIEECERRLGVVFPDELKDLLHQVNGVRDRIVTAGGEVDSGYFLLPIERILEVNTHERAQAENYSMPLDSLLFFADDGIGDYFGFAVIKGQVPHSRIYFWDHEDDSRRSIAPSLGDFIENWCAGRIEV